MASARFASSEAVDGVSDRTERLLAEQPAHADANCPPILYTGDFCFKPLSCADGTLMRTGERIRAIGLACATPGDFSAPGLVIDIEQEESTCIC